MVCKRRRKLIASLAFIIAWLSTAQSQSAAKSQVVRKGDQAIASCVLHNTPRMKVDNVALVCDSPGAYYEGRNSYSNSAVCKTGDKAKMAVNFRILQQWNETMQMNLSIIASLYGNSQRVQKKTNICTYGALSYKSDDINDGRYIPSCPLKKGSYELFSSFTVPKFSSDTYHSFTPDLNITFTDAVDGSLVGCVVTGTRAMGQNHKRKVRQGRIVFIIATTIFLFVFLFFTIICRKRQRMNRQFGRRNNSNDNMQEVVTTRQLYAYRSTQKNGTVLVPDPNPAPIH